MSAEKPAVVLLSGGLDSATVLAIARHEGFTPLALSFRYGQRHVVELDAAARVAAAIGVSEHRVVDIDLRAFGGSALTADIPVPKTIRKRGQVQKRGQVHLLDPSDASLDSARTTEETPLNQPDPFSRFSGDNSIPITYVPARNTIFLSFALALAEVRHARHIFIGVNAVDYSGYPDCRPEYIAAFQRMAALATRAGVSGQPVEILAPLADMTKAAIIRRGLELGVDYGLTRSCYDPNAEGRACRRCDSCRLRLAAFAELDMADPAPYIGG
ncbi:MAG: 7-cyano-7-deazaguanine synthase [Planctomycetes bacterium]|nr:7-cyano-7-deazaguanine synthase [Planctomycetota bacterium]